MPEIAEISMMTTTGLSGTQFREKMQLKAHSLGYCASESIVEPKISMDRGGAADFTPLSRLTPNPSRIETLSHRLIDTSGR